MLDNTKRNTSLGHSEWQNAYIFLYILDLFTLAFDSIFASSPMKSVPPVALWIIQTAQMIFRGGQDSESYSSTWNLFKSFFFKELRFQ